MASRFTPNGLTPVSLEDLRTQISTAIRTAFGQDTKVDPQSRMGQLIERMAEYSKDLNDLVDLTAEVNNPQRSSGTFLDEMVKINDLSRLPALASTVTLTCSAGANGVTIPAGSLVASQNGASQWRTDAELVVPPAVGGENQSGTVAATCTVTGPTVALANTITQILTPIAGWQSVNNTAAAQVGRNRETDAELRVRRDIAAARRSGSSTAGIISAINLIDGVTNLRVVNNNTNATVNGQPAGSVRTVVEGGADADIANALYSTVAAGIETWGASGASRRQVPVVDPISSQSFTMTFERPTDVPIKINVALSTDPATFPSGGQGDISTALIDYVNGLAIGEPVLRSRLFSPINQTPGHSITTLQLNRVATAGWSENDIALTDTEKASLTVENITITATPV